MNVMGEDVVGLACEHCGRPTVYCDSVPDPNRQGMNLNECGYRLQPLCMLCGWERKQVATSRVQHVLRCEKQGFARIDFDRASGRCICPVCGKEYYDHPQEPEHTYLTILCNGWVVKL